MTQIERATMAMFLAALLVATASRAQGWEDGNWAGEDELSAGAPASGSAEGDGGDYVADSGPSMSDFHQGLDEYGRWIDTPEYGLVWQPANDDAAFRPYYSGRWVPTSLGWAWTSDEPYSWAVYHYGRWANLDGTGWVWLPGRVWGAAWVAWRWGGGYAGWAPLGPRGLIYGEPGYYVFVDTPHFLSPVPIYAASSSSVRAVFARAVALPVLRPGPRAGPLPQAVARATGQPVRALPVVDSAVPRAQVAGGSVQVYRPRSVGIPVRTALPASEPERVHFAEPAAAPEPVAGRFSKPAERPASRGWGEEQPRETPAQAGRDQPRAESPQGQGRGQSSQSRGQQVQAAHAQGPTQSAAHAQSAAPSPQAHPPPKK